MSPSLAGAVLVVICAGVEGLAQIALKCSTRRDARRMRWIVAGLALFAVEAVLYTAALQRLELSVAYSLGALSFAAVAIGSAWLLGEALPLVRWLGIGCILAGCSVLASSL